MMSHFYKKFIFISTLLFSSWLFADGTDIRITVSDAASVSENAGVSTFNIQLSEAPDWCDEVVVNYQTANNSATAGSDYVTKSGSVTFYGSCMFPPHMGFSTSKMVSVNSIDDAIYENTERFYLNISNNTTGYAVTDSQGVALIYDDDIQPIKLSTFNDKSITESDADQVLSMVAMFNQNIPSALTLIYHTVDNTALAGSDYVSVSTTITVPANSDRAILPITIKGDLTPESTKNFSVIIDSISSGTIIDSTATATISDDDNIKVSISSSDVNEGNVGDNNNMIFKIFLSKAYPLGTPLNINYTTQDGSAPSATTPSDYTTTSGTVTFNQGEIEKTVLVPIIGDNDIEADENLKMLLSGSPYIITTSSESEILNDDGSYPTLSCNSTNVSIIEGDLGQSIFTYNFTLDSPALPNTSFDYQTDDDDEDDKDDDDNDGDPYDTDEDDDSDGDGDDDDDGDGDGTDDDYVTISNTTYNINTNENNITLTVTINGDTKIEQDELFNLQLFNPTNLKLGSCSTIQSSIINDDGSYPNLSFDNNSFSIVEGNISTQSDLNFTITLDAPAISGSSFDYYTQDSSAKVSDNDYLEINRTTFNIPVGVTQFSIPVTINGDTNNELNEQFYLKIDNEHNLTISGTQTPLGIINNDDVAPTALHNIGEFRFDDCGNGEWKIDHSSVGNNALNATPQIINNDGKAYMCTSLNVWQSNVVIPHHNSYEVDEGTFSMLLYDHHNIWAGNSWMFQKGAFSVEVIRVGGDLHKGSLKVSLDGHLIDTQEVFFTNSDGGDLDTQWIHVTVTFGNDGMKLYVNGIEKGSNPYRGGIKLIQDNIRMATLSGYFDEFYIFEGQMSNIKVNQMYQNTINNINLDGTPRDCGCSLPSDPFTCDSSMYISSSTNRETSATGKMWLHRVNTNQNPFEFEVMEDTGATELYNATAYNPDDNYIYGLYHRELVRLTRGAEVTNLGTITGLPARFDNKQLYAGAISNGYYYVAGRNGKTKKIYKIKLIDKSVTEITLSQKVAIQDFSFYKNVNDAISEGVFLHGIDKNGKLTKIDVRDGTVTQIGANHTGYNFDSSFSDKNGRFFANDSNGNGFFEFDLTTGTKNLVSNSQSATFNDGANCINAALVFNDYGDAPLSYGTPKHNLANGIFMGDNIDHDVTPNYSVDADGDDANGVDDEDGVTLADGSELNGTFFKTNASHTLQVKLSKDAYLNIWIDKDINGHFDNASDLVFNQNLTAGEHNISFNLPAGLQTNQQTYLRARVSSKQNMNPTGFVTDGEVEDYTIKLGEKGIKGTFNIQRTNSLLNAKDFNLYTQIVGRDFNYHVVFYDEGFNIEQNLTEVPVKVELFDAIKGTLLYSSYQYFPNIERSRIPVLLPDDLDDLNATKEALFKISYAVNANGYIVQRIGNANCGLNAQNCYESLIASNSKKVVEAKDKFAIRPESYFIKIADGDQERVNSREPNPHLSMSAGYEYNLTVLAKRYDDFSPSLGYNKNINASFDFNSTGMTSWADNSPITEAINLVDGFYNNSSFKHNEVGLYTLLIPSDENWTIIDQADGDCIVGSSQISGDGNSQSGCNIAQESSPIALTFNPDHFKVDLTLNNLPNSGHDDFIYMSELNSTYSQTAIALQGKIVAQTEDNQTTTNFTVGCMATDIDLELNASTLSVEGKNQQIKTIDGTDVFFTRYIQFNNDLNDSNIVNNLVSLGGTLTLSKNKFLDENNGTATLDIRYNLNKNLTEPINPVQVTFSGMNASSPDAKSTAHTIVDNYIPKGDKLFNVTKNFYYARVVSDLNNYPRVNMNISPLVRTPLNVDIYCKTTVANHCATTNVLSNTSLSSTTREQNGWYLSSKHNGDLDGNVTTLTPNFGTVSINPNNNITLPNGSNGLILNTFNDCSNPKITVAITTTPSLTFNPSQYVINCTDNNASQWTGIGKTGNVLSIKPKVNGTGKMDW